MNAVGEHAVPLEALSPALESPMQELLARLLGETRKRQVRQLMLVGAARGVGTSFIARHWAVQLATACGNVLLIEVTPNASDDSGAVATPAALTARGPVTRIAMPEHVCLGLAGKGSTTLPTEWLDAFGLIVWDVPPLSSAPVALGLAHEVDAVVLLVQAYRTRKQVAMHAALRLQESGGRLLGVVLNRTVNFIPSWIYRLL